jgi:Protein of unknwon function (DUF3310)
MAPTLGETGKCCGHAYNWHLQNGNAGECSACTCSHWSRYGPNRCPAMYYSTSAGTVRCIEEGCPPGGTHRAKHPTLPGTYITFLDHQASNPVAATVQERIIGMQQEKPEWNAPVPVSERQVGGDHYKKHAIQPWDIWDEYDLDRYRANAVKYLLRAGDKGPAVEDLRKALHYIEKAIEREEGK